MTSQDLTNLPDLSQARSECLAFESQIATIGRNRVAKVAEYGAYLNRLFEEQFTKGRPYWKEWDRVVSEWGLVRFSLDRYRLVAQEISTDCANFSSLTDAYAAARKAKADREAAEAERLAAEERRRAEEARAAAEAEADTEAAEAAAEVAKEAEQKAAEAEAAAEKARKKTLTEEEKKAEARLVQPPAGTYQCIVIDPPWPMDVIRRKARPNQVAMPYATLTLDEIRSVSIPKADACHLWLWTTQRFLLDAHELAGAWGFKPLAVITWCKPGGFQPAGLPQFTSEYLLLARRGGLAFDDTKGFSTWYQWPRGAHSEKPEAAYDLIRRVSPGPRIDMFSRREIDGFEAWGAEA